MKPFFSSRVCWLLVALLWLTSCEQTTNPQYKRIAGTVLTGKSKVFKKPEQLKMFLNLYVLTDTFPITISTKVGEREGPESENFKWRGTVVPPTSWQAFALHVPVNPLAAEAPFFATKQFWVNKSTLALLTRVPGEYWSSQVYLFLFDITTRKIVKHLRVAEAWADTGDSFYLESTIDKLPPNEFRIILNQQECHPLDENYEKFTCADSSKIYALSGQHVRLISAIAGKK